MRSSAVISRGSRPSPRAWRDRRTGARNACRVPRGPSRQALWPRSASQPRLADAGRADHDQVVMLADSISQVASFRNRARSMAAMGAEIDRPRRRRAGAAALRAGGGRGACSRGWSPRDRRAAEPVLATEFAGHRERVCNSMNASAMAARPSARRRSTVGWISIELLSMGSSRGARGCSRGSRAADTGWRRGVCSRRFFRIAPTEL